MKEATDNILERWLAAESDGHDTAAERALREMFVALPSALPTADFADRVMAAVAPRRVAVYPWWSRVAVAACLVLVGLAMALVLPVALSLARVITPGEAIGALVQGFVALTSRVDELLSVWRLWAQIVDTALLIATAPPVVVLLLTLTMLSAFTFSGLKRALFPDRSPDHVPAC